MVLQIALDFLIILVAAVVDLISYPFEAHKVRTVRDLLIYLFGLGLWGMGIVIITEMSTILFV